MKPQSLNIIKMISKPLNERMPFQGVQLTKFIQKLSFFKRFFPYQSQKFISLCLSSFLLEFGEGDSIYGRERSPEFIYVVIEGLVEVRRKDYGGRGGGEGEVREVKGVDMLGHVEVVFGLKERGEITRVLKNTYCLVMKSQNFRSVWEKQEQIQKSYHYLKSNKYFQSLTDFDKKHLSLMMIKNSFKQGQVLASSGVLSEKIFFIIYGQAYVIKKLKVKNVEKQVILESLQQMDSFGQFQSVNNLTNQVSLKAASTGTYYLINISQVLQIRHPFVNLAKEKGLPYPDKQQLQFRFDVQSKIEKHKNQVKKNLKLFK